MERWGRSHNKHLADMEYPMLEQFWWIKTVVHASWRGTYLIDPYLAGPDPGGRVVLMGWLAGADLDFGLNCTKSTHKPLELEGQKILEFCKVL